MEKRAPYTAGRAVSWCSHYAEQCGGTLKLELPQKVKGAQSRPILCNAMDCSPPGSSVRGILQARILQWVAIPFSRGSSQPRD